MMIFELKTRNSVSKPWNLVSKTRKIAFKMMNFADRRRAYDHGRRVRLYIWVFPLLVSFGQSSSIWVFLLLVSFGQSSSGMYYRMYIIHFSRTQFWSLWADFGLFPGAFPGACFDRSPALRTWASASCKNLSAIETRVGRQYKVAICITIDQLCINIDELCFKIDVFCIYNDEFCISL